MSWKPAIGRPNCARLLAYSSAVSRQARAAPIDAPQDPVARLAQARQRPVHPGDAGQDRVLGQPHVVEDELGGHRRAQRELALDVLRA